MARGATLVTCCLYEPRPINNQPVAWRFPRRSGWYRLVGSPLLSEGVCEYDMHRSIYCPRMTPYPPRMRRDFEAGQRCNPLCAGSLYGTATSKWGWNFHTLRGGIVRSYLRLCSRVVEVAEIWMTSQCGNETASSPGAAEGRRWPERQLFRRAQTP